MQHPQQQVIDQKWTGQSTLVHSSSQTIQNKFSIGEHIGLLWLQNTMFKPYHFAEDKWCPNSFHQAWIEKAGITLSAHFSE